MSTQRKKSQEPLAFKEFPYVSKKTWKERTGKVITTLASYEKIVWNTDDGIDVEPFYSETEAKDFLFKENQIPGEFPFARGTGKNNNNWLITEDIKETDLETAATAATQAQIGGVDAVTFHIERQPTPIAMKTLVRGINPEKIAVNFAITKDPEKICESFFSACKKKGIDPADTHGTFFFDPLLSVYTHNASDSFLSTQTKKIAQLINLLQENTSHHTAFSVQSSAYRNSGATITQEVAFLASAATEYLVMLTNCGVDIDSACRNLVFSFTTGSSYFGEIAKLRAARILWATIAQAFSPTDPRSAEMRIHCATTTFNKTAYDSHVNIMRATTEAMACVIGGANSLSIEPFDAHCAAPNKLSKTVARNIQLLLRNESHLDAVIDPGGGSHHIEKLTQEIAEKSLKLFQKIEKKGGYLECVKSGFLQNLTAKSREKAVRDVREKKKILVGINQFPNPVEKIAGRYDDEKNKERASLGFEKTRLLVQKYAEKNDIGVIFLLHLSASAKTRAKAVFSMNLFGCGGFSAIDGEQTPGADAGVVAALGVDAAVVVLCGSDDDYGKNAETAISKLKKSGRQFKIVAVIGSYDARKNLSHAGVDDFIQTDCDLCETIEKYRMILCPEKKN